MVKIIEEKPWKWEFDCSKCKSKLEADESDVEWAMFGAVAYDSGDKKYYVTCPVCETDNFVPDNMMTEKLKKTARKYQFK